MPVSNMLSGDRYDFAEPLSDRDIHLVAADPGARVMQTSKPASHETWRQLNDLLFAQRPDIAARVYGFYGVPCDLSFLEVLPAVRRFAADALHGEVAGLEHIARVPHLESLSVGMWELESFSFLRDVSPSLTQLSLGATRSKKPSLQPLSQFRQLRTLALEGHQKEIGALSDLAELEDITLRSVSTPGIDYLGPLSSLWSLDIKLGGIRDLSAIAGMRGIKYLELWQVKGLSDVSVIADLPGIENLFLQSLANVSSLPSLTQAERLRRVVLMNMRGLRDLSPLETAPALEEFALLDGSHNDPGDLAPVLRNGSVRRATAGLGSAKKNRLFEQMRSEAGIDPFAWTAPFVYCASEA